MSFTQQIKKEIGPLQKNYFTLLEKKYSIDGYADEQEAKRASVRGAFLLGGSITDPMKAYHLEIVLPDEEEADELLALMHEYEVDAHIHKRSKSFVLYIKDGEHISKLLALMGAGKAVMDFENARILREMRGSVNRQVNCETANIRRTVDTAIRQIAAIERIEKKMGIDSLPKPLAEVARARLRYPQASLSQLGEYLHPPVGKSGVNHRLRKIKAIAEALN